MKILYVCMKYDYGMPERGLSFEHYNFFLSLLNMGFDIVYFDFMELLKKHGQQRMNTRLLEAVRAEKPDLVFSILFKNEVEKATIRKISADISCPTLNWFCDDHWRYENFSRHWAPCFNWVVTTAESAVPKYHRDGYHNVVKTQWGCNQFVYRKLDLPRMYDVTFVGQPHGNRRQIIDMLLEHGVDVRVWGYGWPAGRVGQDRMIEIFNQSRINLNLPNASVVAPTTSTRPALSTRLQFAVQHPLQAGLAIVGKAGKLARRSGRIGARRDGEGRDDSDPPATAEQIKGRNFEVPGCGGFMLTGRADNIGDYYEDGREIVCFEDEAQLLDKVRFYLSHDDERERIVGEGYERTIREHTYVHRFAQIFSEIGMGSRDVNDALSGKLKPGDVLDVT